VLLAPVAGRAPELTLGPAVALARVWRSGMIGRVAL
jgi:hypothetical protein